MAEEQGHLEFLGRRVSYLRSDESSHTINNFPKVTTIYFLIRYDSICTNFRQAKLSEINIIVVKVYIPGI